jgi:hypothetical protein
LLRRHISEKQAYENAFSNHLPSGFQKTLDNHLMLTTLAKMKNEKNPTIPNVDKVAEPQELLLLMVGMQDGTVTLSNSFALQN